MKKIMAVFDTHLEYVRKLTDFMNLREDVPFEVLGFTDYDQLELYSRNHKIEILLIGDSPEQLGIEPEAATWIGILAEEKEAYHPSCWTIDKYQSADGLIKQVLNLYYENAEGKTAYLKEKRAGIIVVYSPVHRCYKTTFTLIAGQLMAKERKVLYLNLEDCSGFTALIQPEHSATISELFYLYQQKAFEIGDLQRLVETWGQLDYIPPVLYPDDFTEIMPEEVSALLRQIAAESFYDYILIDAGPLGRQAVPLLELCDYIYMPVVENGISEAKIKAFEAFLARSGKAQLTEKIQKIKLPYCVELVSITSYTEQILWNELGDYIRNLLKGQMAT